VTADDDEEDCDDDEHQQDGENDEHADDDRRHRQVCKVSKKIIRDISLYSATSIKQTRVFRRLLKSACYPQRNFDNFVAKQQAITTSFEIF